MRSIVAATSRGILAVLMLALAGAAWAQEPQRAITNIAGDLYRFQNNFHYSVCAHPVFVLDSRNVSKASTVTAISISGITILSLIYLNYIKVPLRFKTEVLCKVN